MFFLETVFLFFSDVLSRLKGAATRGSVRLLIGPSHIIPLTESSEKLLEAVKAGNQYNETFEPTDPRARMNVLLLLSRSSRSLCVP